MKPPPMKPVPILVASLLIVALSGCANTAARSGYAPPVRVRAAPVQPDAAHVAEVDRARRRRGVDVYWVRRPVISTEALLTR